MAVGIEREAEDAPPAHDPVAVERLFVRVREHGDRRARERLVELHMPLARSLVRRYRHSSEPLEDLLQVAALGLVKAIDGFDPDRGRSFTAYAVPTILGELRKHFRDAGWALHVPRKDKELAQAVGAAEAQISGATGRAPTAQRLAEYMEIDLEHVLTGLRARSGYWTLSFDSHEYMADQSGSLRETHGAAEPGYLRVEDAMMLEAALRDLSDGDRELLRMRFCEELTQSQIGERLGVSQMQVSRLLRRCYAELRLNLEYGRRRLPVEV